MLTQEQRLQIYIGQTVMMNCAQAAVIDERDARIKELEALVPKPPADDTTDGNAAL